MGRQWEIPDDVLIPAVRKIQIDKKCTVERLVVYDMERVKALCGSNYAHVPLDDIRHQAGNLRRAGKIGSVKGHGPGKPPPIDAEYQKYLESDHWQEYRKYILEYWDYRCALCFNTASEVHHRTYDNLGHEGITDCILLCRACHKAHHKRMNNKNNKGAGDELGLFQ